MKNTTITLLFFFCALCCKAQNQDETAIKQVIEKETRSFHERDAATMIACHSNAPYALLLVSVPPDVHYSTNEAMNGAESLNALIKVLGAPDGVTFQNTGYTIRINGTSAFVYYDQKETDPTGKVQKSHAVRYMEKTGDKWQIVYIGGVFY
ncbi:MAG: hypothetical protein RLZZ292_412 [Bacteroidota bacterium]|jgi:hypothetical protein